MKLFNLFRKKGEPITFSNVDKIIKLNYAPQNACNLCLKPGGREKLRKFEIHTEKLTYNSNTVIYSRVICEECYKKFAEMLYPKSLKLPIELPEDTKIFIND